MKDSTDSFKDLKEHKTTIQHVYTWKHCGYHIFWTISLFFLFFFKSDLRLLHRPRCCRGARRRWTQNNVHAGTEQGLLMHALPRDSKCFSPNIHSYWTRRGYVTAPELNIIQFGRCGTAAGALLTRSGARRRIVRRCAATVHTQWMGKEGTAAAVPRSMCLYTQVRLINAICGQ